MGSRGVEFVRMEPRVRDAVACVSDDDEVFPVSPMLVATISSQWLRRVAARFYAKLSWKILHTIAESLHVEVRCRQILDVRGIGVMSTLCRLCGSAVGTVFHRIWERPDNKAVEARRA